MVIKKSNKKNKIETVADLMKPKKNISMNAIVLTVKVKKLMPVPKKHIQKKKFFGNLKFLERTKKIQLKQEKRKKLLQM